MNHLDATTIIDLVEQRLEESERESYQRHLAECRHCTEEYEFWWTFLSGLGPSRLTDAPTELVDKCIGMSVKSKPSFGPLHQARIIFDSFLQPLPAMGLRGGLSDSRHLVIRADDFDLHLKISGKDSTRTLQGQLLLSGSDELIEDALVLLCVLGKPTQITFTNRLGEFRFDDVPAGSHRFVIRLISLGRTAEFSVKEGSHAIRS
jgi:hypothetical protein